MKKYIFIIVIVLAAIAAYYFWKKGKIAPIVAPENVPIPPAATPPINQTGTVAGLFSTDTGAGGTAVQQRISEIKASPSAMAGIAAGLNLNTDLYTGLQYLGPIISANVALSTGSGDSSKIPVILSALQKSDIQSLAAVQYGGSNYWDSLGKVVNELVAIQKNTGVRLLPSSDMDPKNLTPLREDIIIKIIDPTARKKNPVTGQPNSKLDEGRLTSASKAFVKDFNTFASNWLSISDKALAEVKTQAINDLRASGWKFAGYDAPQN